MSATGTTRLGASRRGVGPALLLVSGVAALGLSATTARAAVPPAWKNCTTVNRTYPHGVGKATARDRTSGQPVTNLKRSTRLYVIAMGANGSLDRDGDGIACEKQ